LRGVAGNPEPSRGAGFRARALPRIVRAMIRMKRILLPLLAGACVPMLTACPGDDTGNEEVGDTSTTSESSSTTDDPTSSTTDTSTTDDPSTTDTGTTDDPTTETGTTDDPTTETTTDPTTETTTDDPTTDTGGVCGDGMIEGGEDCDGVELGGVDCNTFGFEGGELLCAGDCTYDVSNCFGGGGGVCGDGMWDFDEDCDGADIFGSCTDFGYPGGELGCSDDCTFDFSGCNDCGNDVIDMGEVCDGSALGGQTCAGLGYMFGELACSPTCDSLLEASCSDVQSWIETFEAGAMLPAPWSVGGEAPWAGSGTEVHAGNFAGRSGGIVEDQTSTMQISLNFVSPGTVRFWYRTSSEEGFDYLRFYIDLAPQADWSGDYPWAQSQLFQVPAGNHTLTWEYSKDGSVDEGLDAVFVDDIVTTNAPPP
jgi:hypothetical protein